MVRAFCVWGFVQARTWRLRCLRGAQDARGGAGCLGGACLFGALLRDVVPPAAVLERLFVDFAVGVIEAAIAAGFEVDLWLQAMILSPVFLC